MTRLTFDLQPGDDRVFIDESLEQIGRIEQGLLDLERNLDARVVHEVFRAVHTLKGSAATIGHQRMTELTHAMEDLFGAFRSGTLRDFKPFADALLATVDVLRTLVAEVAAGESLTDASDSLTHQLRDLLSTGTAAAAASSKPGRSGRTPRGAAGHAGGATVAGDADGSEAESSEAAAPEKGVTNVAVAPLISRLLAEAPAGFEPRSLLICRIDPMSEWQAVRMLQLLLEVEEAGVLISTAPGREEIEAELCSSLLAMLVRGRPVELEEMRKRLATIDEVVTVEIVAAPLSGWQPDAVPAVPTVEVHGPGDAAPQLGAVRADDAGDLGPPGPVERRQADLGAEVRGLPAAERITVAGDRLKTAQQTIRIDVSRLDELMNLVGELVVHKTRLQQCAQMLAARLGDDPLAQQADEDAQLFSRIAGQLQDQVTGLRMLPIETIFNRFHRVVRDIATRLDKDVQLVIEGKETELDRSVLEVVGDPLGHLVRNSLDHGIETVEDRRAAGKPLPATIRLTARHADGRVLITVEDDGRGMDPAVFRRAVADKGIMSREEAEKMSDADALRVVFLPGFSTSQVVTDVSGRGVGLDVVRSNMERLGGWVDLASTPGKGTEVSLSLPLTLAIIGALLVRSGARICALPLTGVVETLRVKPESFRLTSGRFEFDLRDQRIPVAQLDHALGDPARPFQPNEHGFVNLVVVRSRGAEMAFAVDSLVGQREILLKSLAGVTGPRHGLAGATVIADGSVGLVVDIPALLERSTAANSGAPKKRAAAPTKRRGTRVA